MRGKHLFRRVLTCAAGALLIGSGPAIAGPASVGTPVSPDAWEHHFEPFRQSINEHILPQHPPIDEIPPMPMPDPGDWRPDPNSPDTLTLFNAETGEEMELPLGQPSGLLGDEGDVGFDGFDGYVDWEDMFAGRAFSNMSQITGTSLDNWPWRGNVKLVMRFVDTSGSDRFFVCSGTMQDAGVVFTAAHCVFNRRADINTWASEVWVYPAWDGVGNLTPGSTGHVERWGWARSTSYIAGSGYVNNGDFDRDVASMRLTRTGTRQVGMLTGWFGWAWGASCSTIQGRTYNNASYPSENCSGNLHNGRDMYYWFGGFDSCPGNQLQIDTTGGCFNAGWGGMSGSGAYYIDGTSRFTHAIASNSNRSTVMRYAKNWEGFIDAYSDQVTANRGTTPDYELLQFRTSGSTSVNSGSQIGPSTVSVTNPTNANPAPRNFTLRVYLSSNNNVQSSDTLLATFNYSSVDFSPMQIRTFNIPAVTIPANTPTGTYWLGAVLDPSTDTNSSNNNVWGWDAQQISVTLQPPAQVTNPSPANGATNQPRAMTKSWSPAARATSYRVNRGTSAASLVFQGTTTGTTWSVPASQHNFGTTYFWRIDAVNAAGTTTGPVWSYTIQTQPMGPRVLLAAAAAVGGAPAPNYDDPRDKLMQTGRFSDVQIFDTTAGTPSLAQLRSFDAVLTWSNASHADSSALGNVLANYVDQGGGVVNAVFNTSTTTTDRFLTGRWISQGYEIIPSQSGNTSGTASLGNLPQPSHPIMIGVNDLSATSAFRPTTTMMTSHGEKVALWNDGRTLAAVSNEFPGRVDLGLYPPSDDVSPGFWTGDGADVLAGALVFAARGSPGWLTTTFASNNGGSPDWGVFYDMTITNPDGLTFSGLDLNARNDAGATIQVQVYIRPGGSGLGNPNGPSDSSAGWQLVATGTGRANANNKATSIDFNNPFELDNGLYGVAIRTTGVGQNYTNGTGNNEFYSSPDLNLRAGMARSGSDGFGGSMFSPRVWNGVLYYEARSAPCIADWNGDGEVDINDFFAYLNDFSNNNPKADLNNDGEIDINDFFIFLTLFEAGC